MDYDAIRQGLANCRFTDHARREMEAEPSGAILTSEVLEALDTGEIIEDCAEDKPYASCLVLGWTIRRRPLHLVCAPVPSERLNSRGHR